ncbi:hypothetical protein SASPL_130708 [Salvia splendens]|uniref:Alcohol dehydrogenase n=1 Tax=Salvia splendens TaxID=180675 RepID=A0A8X8ZK73_SALSN|nr:hypothetical protein SASPL_130708 [Salvia splendens]
MGSNGNKDSISNDTIGKVITCKAAVAYGPGQPLMVEDIRVDPPHKMELRIRVLFTSICQTDLTYWRSQDEAHRIFPRIFGHEASGEWFFDFEELNGGLVYMGNDSPCKTTGIGSIKLRNQDGSTRILKDVRYVPQLKKNLISLGALESKGLVVIMRDGILKATSGALVMLKGVRKNNLYYYQGSTVVGTVATTTSSNKKDAEATKLWHLRLGHAEVWSGKPATDYDSLHIFGSIAYYHVTESKLDPRAKKVLFMGFSAGVKGYRLWCLDSKKTIVSRDVTFDESSMLNKVNPNSSDTSQQAEYTPKQVEFEEAVVIPTTNTTNDSPTEEEESDDEEVPPQEP